MGDGWEWLGIVSNGGLGISHVELLGYTTRQLVTVLSQEHQNNIGNTSSTPAATC